MADYHYARGKGKEALPLQRLFEKYVSLPASLATFYKESYYKLPRC